MADKTIWRTRFFEIAEKRGISLNELSRIGNGEFSVPYLSRIKRGERKVPDTFAFQNWAARVLGLPRENIFFTEILPTEDNISDKEKQAS